MKTVGMIGGMSWESSAIYYRLINDETKRRLGGHHNAPSVMVTVDFADIECAMSTGRWDAVGTSVATAALQVEAAGAEFLILCTNTIHKVADSITAAVHLPFLHIVDVTAAEIRAAGLTRIGLLGTRFTMEDPFYSARMRDRFGIDILIPGDDARRTVHQVIFDELVHGVVRDESRERYRAIIAQLADASAEGVILGCTEIGLLIAQHDSPIPVFDSTVLHARAAVDYALEQ